MAASDWRAARLFCATSAIEHERGRGAGGAAGGGAFRCGRDGCGSGVDRDGTRGGPGGGDADRAAAYLAAAAAAEGGFFFDRNPPPRLPRLPRDDLAHIHRRAELSERDA